MNRKLRARPDQADVPTSVALDEADLFIEVDGDQYRVPPPRLAMAGLAVATLAVAGTVAALVFLPVRRQRS